jgi:transposase
MRRWEEEHPTLEIDVLGGEIGSDPLASGRPLEMGRTARKALETLLLRGARAAGYATDLWTCPRIAQIISQNFGVHYHVDHIGRLLRSLGWSPQKPQRRAIERDKAAI